MTLPVWLIVTIVTVFIVLAFAVGVFCGFFLGVSAMVNKNKVMDIDFEKGDSDSSY